MRLFQLVVLSVVSYEGTHVDFLGFVSGEEVISDGDAIPVHKKPHFHDGIRAVVLFGTSLSVLCRNRLISS